jgi:hypothetical protein
MAKRATLATWFRDGKKFQVHRTGEGLFISVNGVTIARRGDPGTPQAKTWISLNPDWIVTDHGDMEGIEVSYRVQP